MEEIEQMKITRRIIVSENALDEANAWQLELKRRNFVWAATDSTRKQEEGGLRLLPVPKRETNMTTF